jgi:hypothetical protein
MLRRLLKQWVGPTMRFVPIKTDDQLDLQSLHRVRERWVMRRTAVVNQVPFLADGVSAIYCPMAKLASELQSHKTVDATSLASTE